MNNAKLEQNAAFLLVNRTYIPSLPADLAISTYLDCCTNQEDARANNYDQRIIPPFHLRINDQDELIEGMDYLWSWDAAVILATFYCNTLKTDITICNYSSNSCELIEYENEGENT